MVIGNGLIASLFTNFDSNDIIIFASGVSNSLEMQKIHFNRESRLIEKTISENKDKVFVYFSTCSIYDPSKFNSAYIKHKLRMEQLIKTNCRKSGFLILRVSNAIGLGGNPNLLLNHLVYHIKQNLIVTVYMNATRNLIDVQDLQLITYELLNKNTICKTINVAYIHNYSIHEIIDRLEKHLKLSTQYKYLNVSQAYNIDIDENIRDYFVKNNKCDKNAYLDKMLLEYF